MAWPDAEFIPKGYRFFRDEFPGGRYAAPVIGWAVYLLALGWIGKTMLLGVGIPAIQLTSGQPIAITFATIGQVGATIIGTWFLIRAVRKRLDQFGDSLIDKYGTLLDEVTDLRRRLKTLESRSKPPSKSDD